MKKHGLTSRQRRIMTNEDVAEWVEKNKEALVNSGSLTIQSDPFKENKEIWYLKFEFEKK